MGNLELVALRKRLVIEDSHLAEVLVHSLAAVEVAVRILAGEGTAHSLAGVLAARSPAEMVDRKLAVRNLAAADMLYVDHNFAVVAAVAGTHNSDRILESHIDLAEVHRTAARPKGENSARLSCRKMNRSPPSVI